MEPRALHRALEDGYLLPERHVLRSERRATLADLSEEDGENVQSAH